MLIQPPIEQTPELLRDVGLAVLNIADGIRLLLCRVCDVCLEPEARRVHNHLLGHDNWRCSQTTSQRWHPSRDWDPTCYGFHIVVRRDRVHPVARPSPGKVYHISTAGAFAGGPRDKGCERISMRGGWMCVLFRHQEDYGQSSSGQTFLLTGSCQRSTVSGVAPFQKGRVHRVFWCGPPKCGARRRSSRAPSEGAGARFVTGPPMFRAERGTKSIHS